MTPDEARDLLDNFDRLLPFEAELELEGAAKDMAAMIAGMHEEWGVSCGGKKPGAWWASREEADQCAKRMSIGTHYPRPIVVVRRYVTTPEEA